MENTVTFFLIGWGVFTLAVILLRVKFKRQAVAPLFLLYLLSAAATGLGLAAVGLIYTFTGKYPAYGALVDLIALVLNPFVLLSLFLAPIDYSRGSLAFLAIWYVFCLSAMFATGDGCPPWLLPVEGLAGGALAVGSTLSLIKIAQLRKEEAPIK